MSREDRQADDLPELRRDHILRARLPWRDAALTECGRDGDDVASAIGRDEYLTRRKKLGQQRVAFTVCMTCARTCVNYKTWDQDPVDAMRRETYYPHRTWDRLNVELRAIAALVDAHRDEFDDFISGWGQTTQLDAARRRKRRLG